MTKKEDKPQADTPAAESQPVRGRALIDLPAHALKCGEYGAVPPEAAAGLVASGQFDDQATPPEQTEE